MRRLLTLTFALTALGAAYAHADTDYVPGKRGGGLGGGLFELLVSGGQNGVVAPGALGATYAVPDAFPQPQRPRARAAEPRDPNVIYAAPEAGGPAPRVASISPAQEPIQAEIPPQFQRQEVAYDGAERPGVIVIDTPNKFLFLVEPGGRAMRYGIGVGRPGFAWAGVKTISRKAEWPDWTPPPEMLLRRPELPRHLDGGPGNPLGARAMYLGSSMYRIHGTNEPWSIGQNVSSGCIRMMNEDVIDLYERVRVGTKVIVL